MNISKLLFHSMKYVLPIWDQIVGKLFLNSFFWLWCLPCINFTWTILSSVIRWMLHGIAIKALLKSSYVTAFPPFCPLDQLFCQRDWCGGIHSQQTHSSCLLRAVMTYKVFFQWCPFKLSFSISKFSGFALWGKSAYVFAFCLISVTSSILLTYLEDNQYLFRGRVVCNYSGVILISLVWF